MKIKLVLSVLMIYTHIVTGQSCYSEHRTIQTTLTSPNYPGRYYSNVNCDYVIKSPYTCENEFNVNFMDFSLETSPGCINDKLIISYTDLENQEDRDIICGSVIGLKTYKTINGVLNIKFVTDEQNQDLGFKISVTRLPCVAINEISTVYSIYNLDATTTESDDSNIVAETFPVETTEPPLDLDLIPPEITNTSDFDVRTLTVQPASSHYYPPGNFYLPPQTQYPAYPNYPGNNNGYYPNNCCDYNNNRPQYPTYPNYPTYPTNPTYPTSPTYPTNPTYRPPNWNPHWLCNPSYPNNPSPNYPQNPITTTPYPNVIPPLWTEPAPTDPPIVIPIHYKREPLSQQTITPQFPVNCCRSTFNQNRFYLTTPGFPSNVQPQGECIFIINKSNPNICRLTIRFKFFLIIDQTNQCLNNFLEIDGNRICGCRSGLVYESQWGTGDKIIRLRTTADNSRPVKGFLLEVIQEECPNRYFSPVERRQWNHNRPIANLEAYIPPRTAVVQTNTTSLATYYYYDRPQNNGGAGSTNEIDEPLKAEQPRARFFYGTGFLNTNNLCSFGFLEWAILTVQQLWTNRPVCYAPQPYNYRI